MIGAELGGEALLNQSRVLRAKGSGSSKHWLRANVLRIDELMRTSFSPVVDGAEEGECTYTIEKREGKAFLCLKH